MSCKHEHEGATPSSSTKAAGSAPRRSTSSVRKRDAFDSRSQLSRVSDVQRQHAWLPTKTYGSDSRGTLQAVVRPVTARGCHPRYEGSTPFGRSDPSTSPFAGAARGLQNRSRGSDSLRALHIAVAIISLSSSWRISTHGSTKPVVSVRLRAERPRPILLAPSTRIVARVSEARWPCSTHGGEAAERVDIAPNHGS